MNPLWYQLQNKLMVCCHSSQLGALGSFSVSGFCSLHPITKIFFRGSSLEIIQLSHYLQSTLSQQSSYFCQDWNFANYHGFDCAALLLGIENQYDFLNLKVTRLIIILMIKYRVVDQIFFSWEVKFIYSEKATKFCEIFTLLLTVCTVVKS